MAIIPQAIANHGKFFGDQLPAGMGLVGQAAKALGKTVNPAKKPDAAEGTSSLNTKATDTPKSLLG